MLDKLGFEVAGEYQYMRSDTDGGLKEHSVDLRARKFIYDSNERSWATFELLVECKYNHPGCHWFFVPGKLTGHGYAGTASLHEDLCPLRTRNHHLTEARLWEIDRRTERCVKGVVVHRRKGGSGVDRNQVAIEHGLAQLRYAVPQLLSRAYQYQGWGKADTHVHAVVLCALLVTNAPLYVIKKRATVRQFQSARDVRSMAKEYPFVRIAQSLGPDLERYVDRFAKATIQSEAVAARLQEVAGILAGKPTLAPQDWSIKMAIERATEVVTVVRLAYFARLLRWYLARLNEVGRDLVQYATLKWDPARNASRLEGLNPDLLTDDINEVVASMHKKK